MQILIVEDEPKIASFVKRGLTAEGFTVSIADDGREGLALARTGSFDLVVLDLMLPGLSGEEVLAGIRAADSSLPVIVLTAKDDVADRVANLNAGADDYLTKPFSFAELLARVHARLRQGEQASATSLRTDRVHLDLRTRRAEVDGRRIELTAREFALLEMFMRNAGQVLSQPVLIDRVWGYDFDPGSNVVEVYVRYLRKKLGADMIETVRGAGYRFAG